MSDEKVTGVHPLMGIGIMGTALTMVIHIAIGILLGYQMNFLFIFYLIFTICLVIGLVKSD